MGKFQNPTVFLQYSSEVTAQVQSTHRRHSQGAGGLEILCLFILTAESALIETLKKLLNMKVEFHFCSIFQGDAYLFYLEKLVGCVEA